MDLRPLQRLLWGAVCACLTPLANAAVLEIEALGTVTFVNNTNGFFPAGIASASAGDPFRVVYFIDDSATTDTNANPNAGNYNAAMLTMSVTINNTFFAIPGNFNFVPTLAVFDDLFLSSFNVFRDALVIQDSGCETAANGMCSSSRLEFLNSSATAPVTPFTSDAFRAVPGDLSQFQVARLLVGIGPGPTISNPVFDQLGGNVTSVTILSPVPQPASVGLMLLGLASLGGYMMRRRPATN